MFKILPLLLGFILAANSGFADKPQPSLGIAVCEVNDYEESFQRNKWKCPVRKGIIVTSVALGGPCDGKISCMGVITAINGTEIFERDDYSRKISEMEIGKDVALTVYNVSWIKDVPRWKKVTIRISPVPFLEAYSRALRQSVDDVNKQTVYTSLDSPTTARATAISAKLIVPDNAESAVVLRVSYLGSELIGMRSLQILSDGLTLEFDLTGMNADHHFDSERLSAWEWVDLRLTNEQIRNLGSVPRSLTNTVRINGRDYIKEWRMSESEKRSFLSVLATYQYLQPNHEKDER